jgi:plastocyanin
MAPSPWLLLLFVFLVAACLGCGGNAAPETLTAASTTQAFPAASPDDSGRPPPATIDITINTDGLSFSPHQVHGNAGDLVVVTLVGSGEQHSFTIDALGVDEVVKPQTTRRVRFTAPPEGITPFYCRFHGSAASGMHGLLIFH